MYRTSENSVTFVRFGVTYPADEKGGHPAGLNPSSQLCDLRQFHPFQASGASSMIWECKRAGLIGCFLGIRLVNFIAGWSQ